MIPLINVSNRLPVTISDTIKKSSGGLVSALEGVKDKFELHWYGWPGGTVDDEQQRCEISDELQSKYQYYPVFLSQKEIDDYYTGFSNTSLWPLLHYMSPYAHHDESWFETYKIVNHRFADTVIKHANENAVVWVHDYHLMLLPMILKKARPDLRIGYFLHTPFPSYELFRCHPDREELLAGLLGADLIGFHTFGYLRHFRSTVLRILGIESETDYINHDNMVTRLGVYPIGIDSDKFNHQINSPECREHMETLRQTYEGKKIILSVERLDYTKGILQKLDAIERFLSESPERSDLVFIFICVPSRGQVVEYQNLIQNVEIRVSKINGKYSTINNSPIHFIHKSVPFSQLCAIYALADIAIVTPLIDGMNMVAKEYVACQQGEGGVLILSEFAGSAQELFNAIVVNPYDIRGVADSIKTALELPEKDKRQMIQPMRERVLKFNARHWAQLFIKDLTDESIQRRHQPVVTQRMTVDLIEPLKPQEKNALFLDYDGTLCEIKRKPMDAYPHADIKDLFALLQNQPNLDVYIISGRKRDDMELWFSDYPFTLISEHGYYYKTPGSPEWHTFENRADLSWKGKIIEIFRHFSDMTPGTVVEEKTSSVVWHYRRADPEFGTWKAGQLMGELYEVISNLPVVIHQGKKIVEVSSTQINKGLAMEHFLLENKYDRVICAGDDETDESMFRLDHEQIISIKVGQGDTSAKYFVADPASFRNYLRQTVLSKS